MRPVMEYGAACWDPYRLEHIKTLEKIQKRALKCCRKNSPLKWDTLTDRRTRIRLCALFKTYRVSYVNAPITRLNFNIATNNLLQLLNNTYLSNPRGLKPRLQCLVLRTNIKNDAETDQEEEKELVGSPAEKKLPTEGCTGRNSEREKSSGQKKISDDRRH
ncbi:hypothetical protein ANN_12818 [Periplaneta americana]|uniref:Endonuclease-reverse transcriptase n=1 Tax=Periplaneta americana TaxID=6978 RepID=A0ABQ8THM3_PERAM|nr:hypothetical protein ANN_12818 [Periplaneta americana]